MLVAESGLLDDYRVAEIASDLLGRRGEPRLLREYVAGMDTADDGRAQIVTLALVLGALENRYTKGCSRRSSRRHGPAPLARESC